MFAKPSHLAIGMPPSRPMYSCVSHHSCYLHQNEHISDTEWARGLKPISYWLELSAVISKWRGESDKSDKELSQTVARWPLHLQSQQFAQLTNRTSGADIEFASKVATMNKFKAASKTHASQPRRFRWMKHEKHRIRHQQFGHKIKTKRNQFKSVVNFREKLSWSMCVTGVWQSCR